MLRFTVKFEQHELVAETMGDTLIQEILDLMYIHFQLDSKIAYDLLIENEPLENQTSLNQNFIKNNTVFFLKRSNRFELSLIIEYDNSLISFQGQFSEPLMNQETYFKSLFFIHPLSCACQGKIKAKVKSNQQVSDMVSYFRNKLGYNLTFMYEGQVLQQNKTLQELFENKLLHQPIVFKADLLQTDYRVFLFIKNTTEIIKINLQPSSLISLLETLLEARINQKVRIFYKDTQLISNLSLFQQNIPSESFLELKFTNNEAEVHSPLRTKLEEDIIDIIVNVFGENLQLKVSVESFISDFMDIIKQEKQINVITELVGENKVLKSYLTFRQQGVVSGWYLNLRQVDINRIKLENKFS